MATLEEKRAQLVSLLGGDEAMADNILQQVASKEAQADAQHLAFKEVSAEAVAAEAEAVTLKKADKPAAEEEEELDEAELEDESEDEESDEEDDEFDDEELDDEEKELDTQFLGDVPADIFYERVADAFVQAVEPLMQQLKELRGLAEISSKEKKANDEQVSVLTTKLQEQEKELGKLRKTVKGMQADVPRGARQFLASQEEETIVSPERAKELGVPQPDPLSDFAAFALGKQTPQ